MVTFVLVLTVAAAVAFTLFAPSEINDETYRKKAAPKKNKRYVVIEE